MWERKCVSWVLFLVCCKKPNNILKLHGLIKSRYILFIYLVCVSWSYSLQTWPWSSFLNFMTGHFNFMYMYQLQGQGYYRGQRSNLFSFDFHDFLGANREIDRHGILYNSKTS